MAGQPSGVQARPGQTKDSYESPGHGFQAGWGGGPSNTPGTKMQILNQHKTKPEKRSSEWISSVRLQDSGPAGTGTEGTQATWTRRPSVPAPLPNSRCLPLGQGGGMLLWTELCPQIHMSKPNPSVTVSADLVFSRKLRSNAVRRTGPNLRGLQCSNQRKRLSLPGEATRAGKVLPRHRPCRP